MDIDKDRLRELSDLFAEADAKVKEVEEIDGDIAVPSINELRYVGYHLIRALASEHPAIEPELNKAADHARRAIYDAAEAQVIFFLEKVKSFQKFNRKAASVTEVISDYLTLMQQAEQAKKNQGNQPKAIASKPLRVLPAGPPSASNNNLYSESLFRTVKYSGAAVKGLCIAHGHARERMLAFGCAYNEKHLRSGIRLGTSSDRHRGVDHERLAHRKNSLSKSKTPECKALVNLNPKLGSHRFGMTQAPQIAGS